MIENSIPVRITRIVAIRGISECCTNFTVVISDRYLWTSFIFGDSFYCRTFVEVIENSIPVGIFFGNDDDDDF